MRVLIVKTSSMGDVIHTLPALTDALRARPDLQLDWLVEEGFTEIPSWHSGVQQVIPVALRRWRKRPLQAIRSGQWKKLRMSLRREKYDLVIDAQGLLKSACLARLVPAPCVGLDKSSAREPIASWFYQRGVLVPRQQHAVERTRDLFASALNYTRPRSLAEYGLCRNYFSQSPVGENRIVFIHGTTRGDKLWPEVFWQQLCCRLGEEGFHIRLPWGNESEHFRAQRIAEAHKNAEVLPRMTLREFAVELVGARAAVAVDTGPGHLAAALSVPTVSLYGTTSPTLVGTYGRHQQHLSTCHDQRSDRKLDFPPAMVHKALIDCFANAAA